MIAFIWSLIQFSCDALLHGLVEFKYSNGIDIDGDQTELISLIIDAIAA